MTTASDHLDPRILGALNLAEDYWKLGDPAAVVTTESGSRYIVQPDGTVTGGGTIVSGKLSGAVYRPGGPIRMGAIVYGLSMEIARGAGRVTVTTPVVAIEDC